MTRDEEALRAAVEQSAAVLTAAGFPRMPARVLMALLVSEGGRTASELGAELGVSAAAISGAVRYLQSLGILNRVSTPGSRRDRWEILDDAWYTALAGKNSTYGAVAAIADQAVAAIGDPEAVGSRRTAEMAAFFRFIEARMPELLVEWEVARAGG